MKQFFDEGSPGKALLLRDLYSCSVFKSRSAAKEMLKISLLFSNLLNMLNMWWRKRRHSFAEKRRCIWKLHAVKRFQEVRFQIKRTTRNASTRSNMPTNKFNAVSKIFMWRNAMCKSQFTPPPSPIFGHSNTTCRVTCNLRQLSLRSWQDRDV